MTVCSHWSGLDLPLFVPYKFEILLINISDLSPLVDQWFKINPLFLLCICRAETVTLCTCLFTLSDFLIIISESNIILTIYIFFSQQTTKCFSPSASSLPFSDPSLPLRTFTSSGVVAVPNNISENTHLTARRRLFFCRSGKLKYMSQLNRL